MMRNVTDLLELLTRQSQFGNLEKRGSNENIEQQNTVSVWDTVSVRETHSCSSLSCPSAWMDLLTWSCQAWNTNRKWVHRCASCRQLTFHQTTHPIQPPPLTHLQKVWRRKDELTFSDSTVMSHRAHEYGYIVGTDPWKSIACCLEGRGTGTGSALGTPELRGRSTGGATDL